MRGPLALQRLTGHCHGDAGPASVVVAGACMQSEYLVRRLFAEPPHVQQLGRSPVRGLQQALSAVLSDSDLVIARVPRPLTPMFTPRYVQVPGLIELAYDVGPTEEEFLSRLSARQRRYAREVRARGYRWQLGRSQDDLDRFYYEYYVPGIKERFADLAVVQAIPVLRRQLRFGGILWLMLGDKRVAGDLYRVGGEELRQMFKGVRQDLAHEGSPSPHVALMLFAAELARSSGLRRISLGGSVPSLRDGSLRFKAAWGGSLQEYGDSHRDLLVRWTRPTAAVRQLLSAAPLIARTQAGFVGIAAAAQDATALWKELRVGNLHGLAVIGSGDEVTSIGPGRSATRYRAGSSEELLLPWCGAASPHQAVVPAETH